MDNGAFVWTVNYQTSGSVRGGEALLLPATNGVEGMSPPTTDSHGVTVHWTGGAGEGGGREITGRPGTRTCCRFVASGPGRT